MRRASELFTVSERAAVEKAVADAEAKTSGEIVPVVATASGRYDRAEDLFGVLCTLVLLVIAWVFFQGVVPAEGDWEMGQRIQFGLIPVLLTVLVGFCGGTVLASLFPTLRLPFVTRGEMAAEVERAAGEAFQRFRVRGTKGKTGILIYISLYEHMVRIMGDDELNRLVAQSDWDAVGRAVADAMRRGSACDVLIEGVSRCGVILADQFPIEEGDVNELPNEVRFVDAV
jgi:putative membrane protein